MRPWRAGIVVDPVRLVREGRLEVVGEAEVDGRAAYLVVVDPDPSQSTRLFVAQDDGTCCGSRTAASAPAACGWWCRTTPCSRSAARRPRTLAELLGRG